ncbi:hypothetical protein [Rhizobium azibense]|uniref:hypothetical protein n=1 Tax=Rhizobium azibense TaxID=1136135 RepID=UPI0010483C79|nr:hypothetical protein [Rhizobium azibense]
MTRGTQNKGQMVSLRIQPGQRTDFFAINETRRQTDENHESLSFIANGLPLSAAHHRYRLPSRDLIAFKQVPAI